MTAKILFIDIETAPNLGYVWGKWDQNVISFEHQQFLLAVGWKWAHEAETHVLGLVDYDEYGVLGLANDSLLVSHAWGLFDKADIIIAHNGDAFDIKRCNARFIYHNLPPPSSYKTVDTLKLAKKFFKFESNALSDLGEYLGLGPKMNSGGFDTWKGCMLGDLDAWKKMKEYNLRDVNLLEQVYNKLRPWAPGHVNLNLYSDHDGCPSCHSTAVQRRGFSYAKTQIRQRWRCTSCGTWYAGKIVKKAEVNED